MEAVMEFVWYCETFVAVVKGWGYFRRFLFEVNKRAYLGFELSNHVERRAAAFMEKAFSSDAAPGFVPSMALARC